MEYLVGGTNVRIGCIKIMEMRSNMSFFASLWLHSSAGNGHVAYTYINMPLLYSPVFVGALHSDMTITKLSNKAVRVWMHDSQSNKREESVDALQMQGLQAA